MRTSFSSLPLQRQLLSTGWQKNIIKYVCLSHKLKCVGFHTGTWYHSGSCRNLGQAKQIEEGARVKRHYSIHNNPNLTFICREKKVVVCCWRSSRWISGGWSTAPHSLTYYGNSCSLETRFGTEKSKVSALKCSKKSVYRHYISVQRYNGLINHLTSLSISTRRS